MNFKKSYKSANGYTKISKIGESSLKKLEFGIIELKAGDALDFYTEDLTTGAEGVRFVFLTPEEELPKP